MNEQMIASASRSEEEKEDGNQANNSRHVRKCSGLIDV
jgi:hypothetical protein